MYNHVSNTLQYGGVRAIILTKNCNIIITIFIIKLYTHFYVFILEHMTIAQVYTCVKLY